MSCAQTFNVGAVTILLGKSTMQEGCITALAGTSLGGKYFVMHTPVTQAKTYFWFNTGASVDPAISGATGVEVAILVGDTASEVATKLAVELNSAAFIGTATADGAHISFDMAAAGYAYAHRDGEGALKTGFTFSVSKYGATQVDVGALDGTSTITIEQRTKEVVDSRYGNSLADELILGWNVTAAWSMKDTSLATLQKYLGLMGGVYVPDDGSGAKLAGLGTAFIGKSKKAYATQVVFRPTKNVATSDATEDRFIPLATLDLTAFEFDPENEQVIPVTAKAFFADPTEVNAFVNFFGLGDAAAAQL